MFDNVGKVPKTNLELGKLFHTESNYLSNCMERWVVFYYYTCTRHDPRTGFKTTNWVEVKQTSTSSK